MSAQGQHTANNQVPDGRAYCLFAGLSRPSIWTIQPQEAATREQARGERDESPMQEGPPVGTVEEDDNSSGKYKLPESTEARQCCMGQYEVMQRRRANHICNQEPCFEDTCARNLPGGKGCRYSEAFHLESTRPCMWGWGKILIEHARIYGWVAAMKEELDKIAQLYRERHVHDKRFEGPVVVKDPPDASGNTPYYLVVEPSEQNGLRRQGAS